MEKQDKVTELFDEYDDMNHLWPSQYPVEQVLTVLSKGVISTGKWDHVSYFSEFCFCPPSPRLYSLSLIHSLKVH